MPTDWLSESISEGAKTVILLGPLSSDLIEDHSDQFPLGVLWFAPVDLENVSFAENIKIIKRNKSLSELKQALSDFILLDYDSPPSVKVSNEISNNSLESYTKILDFVIAEIDTTMRARRTRAETGFIRQRQVFVNLAGYLKKRIPNEWSKLGQGALGVVVGAGPSLDVTLPLIKNDIPRPLIVAADSSLRALMKFDLEPDFVVSIDPEKTFQSCSEQGYTPGIAVLSSQSHKSWASQWGDKCCFLSGRVLTEDWLAEKGISKTNLLAVNNAGLTALVFADFLNTSALLTVGLDLAGGGQGEVRYAEITGRSQMQIHASHYHEVPGNFNNTVLTPFLSDWQETSDHTKKITKRKTLINLNDRGAKLEGASLVHPEQINELREVLNESFLPFTDNANSLLDKRKTLGGHGMNQLLCQLVAHCDHTWSTMPAEDNTDCNLTLNFFKELMTGRDTASLLGDFAFSIIPKLSPGKVPTNHELENAMASLRDLLWRLEDSVLDCAPNEEFLLRFFTEKFS